MREEMKLLTLCGWDKMTTICNLLSLPNTPFFQTTQISLQFAPNGSVNYKSKLVQAIAGYREDTKPLPESGVIQANGVYMSLSDWLSWLFTVLGKYIHAEKNATVWAHEGCFHPHIWKWAIPTPTGWVGARDGFAIFCKIPISNHSGCGMTGLSS